MTDLLNEKLLELDHEGAGLRGTIYYPEHSGSQPLATVMVFHDAMGLSPFTRERALMLAAQGYLAIVIDMYGDAVYCDQPDDAGQYYMQFHRNPELLPTRLLAWYETVNQLPEVDSNRMAAIGYCFGGQCVLELARSGVDVQAVASFHGILKTSNLAKPASLGCNVAVYNGSEDPWVPAEDVQSFREEFANSGAKLQFTDFAGVCHGFTNPAFSSAGREGIRYDALADKCSWAGMLALLEYSLAE